MSDKPFGETFYRNYDPNRVNSIDDAVELFRWLSNENRERDNQTASNVYRDCARLIEEEVLNDE